MEWMDVESIERRKGYELSYRKEFRIVSKSMLSEEKCFANYLNKNVSTIDWFKNDVKFGLLTVDVVSYFDTVYDVLKSGGKLSLFIRQDFMHFIDEWIFTKGWSFSHMKFYQTEGVDLITIKSDTNIGDIKCVWKIKKFASHRPVGVNVIRELEYSIRNFNASKGILLTTSKLTKGALKLIEKNRFIMSYIDGEMLQKDLFKLGTREICEDLPF